MWSSAHTHTSERRGSILLTTPFVFASIGLSVTAIAPLVSLDTVSCFTIEVKMSISGITLDDEALEAFNRMKMKKTHEMMIFQIKNKKAISFCEEMSRETFSNEELHKYLTIDYKDEYLYMLHDFKCTTKQELILISWIPDGGAVGSRMLYASSIETLKKKFVGVKHFIEAHDLDDLNRELLSKLGVPLLK